MKEAIDIIKWGRIKPYFDKKYSFNTIDIETVDNELFLLGCTINNKYVYYLDDFYNNFHKLLIRSVQMKKDVLTWSRYDNTHLVKLILSKVENVDEINKYLLRIGKISPIYEYQFKNFTFTLENIIKDSMIFKITDKNNRSARVIVYNLKNLFTTDLETTAKNYRIDYYSKIGEEYHIIDKEKFYNDSEYRKLVLLSNELDNKVLIDIASRFLENFKNITGVYPKSIFTAGSIARSYLLASKDTIDVSIMNFKAIYNKHRLFNKLLDYSMKAYHGGKIESYVLGYIKSAKVIDISSAYPFAFTQLPKLTNKVTEVGGDFVKGVIDNYYYAFIRCNIYIKNPEFIHPVIVKNPIAYSNISPFGHIQDVIITKIEYDYLIKNNIPVEILDAILIEHENEYPYHDLMHFLFNSRLEYMKTNPSLADLYKTISNSQYGIKYELTDIYKENENGEIEWLGYRAGDFFNPIEASYITALIRTYLSEVSYNIILNGGEVYLNMTDSIFYNGEVTLDVFSETKILGKFDKPKKIKDVIILGAGRYEYFDEIKNKFTIKNRGFSVNDKEKSFYSQYNLNDCFYIPHKSFVSSFRATTKKYSFQEMGHLVDDVYEINPFNLGGKRYVKDCDRNKNLNETYIKTYPIYFDKYLYIDK